jgi:hypothetical protein
MLRESFWLLAASQIKTRANFVKVLSGSINKTGGLIIGAAHWLLSTTLTK